MRKGFNGLSALVTGKMGKDPISDDVFIFINRRATQIKILLWESGGFVIYYKPLEKRHLLPAQRTPIQSGWLGDNWW